VKRGICTKHGAVRKNKRSSVLGCNKEAKKEEYATPTEQSERNVSALTAIM
jgi:hypothetical protein